ncbi:MAG: tetratricopeptide repeat-containing glycosyltransferase family 2 protein [Sarcina sp.]
MIEISLCMIIKNEENVLGRCIESVKDFVEEIIIVDTGSTDKSKDIAAKYNANIFDFEWCDDFAKARNFSFSKATKEFIFWLDADDYITEENLNKLLELKKEITSKITAVSMHYSLKRNAKGETTFSLKRNRLVRRDCGFKWNGRIHEYLDVSGEPHQSNVYIHHDKDKEYTNRNLNIFNKMKESGEKFTDRDLFYYASELYHKEMYDDAIIEYEKFIDNDSGWFEDLKTATINLVHCYSKTGKEEKKFDYILNSFKWGMPRADLCCMIAEDFIKKEKFEEAIFWYKTALDCKHDSNEMGKDMREYYTWVPNMQLSVCYAKKEDFEQAYYYNEIAALYVPDSIKVKHNRNFLEDKFNELGKKIPKYDDLEKYKLNFE